MFRFGFVGGHFSVFPILLGWDAEILGTQPLEQGSIGVPSQKVAQMTFLGSIWLETQEKVTLGGGYQTTFVFFLYKDDRARDLAILARGELPETSN